MFIHWKSMSLCLRRSKGRNDTTWVPTKLNSAPSNAAEQDRTCKTINISLLRSETRRSFDSQITFSYTVSAVGGFAFEAQ